MRPSYEHLDRMIALGEHARARKIIRTALKKSPDDHRLLTAMARSFSDTYVRKREWQEAMAWHRRALASAPQCPFVLRDYAETARKAQAIATLRGLIASGARGITRDRCIRSPKRARHFITFTYLLLSFLHYRYSEWPEALKAGRAAVRRANEDGDRWTGRAAMTVVRWVNWKLSGKRRSRSRP